MVEDKKLVYSFFGKSPANPIDQNNVFLTPATLDVQQILIIRTIRFLEIYDVYRSRSDLVDKKVIEKIFSITPFKDKDFFRDSIEESVNQALSNQDVDSSEFYVDTCYLLSNGYMFEGNGVLAENGTVVSLFQYIRSDGLKSVTYFYHKDRILKLRQPLKIDIKSYSYGYIKNTLICCLVVFGFMIGVPVFSFVIMVLLVFGVGYLISGGSKIFMWLFGLSVSVWYLWTIDPQVWLNLKDFFLFSLNGAAMICGGVLFIALILYPFFLKNLKKGNNEFKKEIFAILNHLGVDGDNLNLLQAQDCSTEIRLKSFVSEKILERLASRAEV